MGKNDVLLEDYTLCLRIIHRKVDLDKIQVYICTNI